MAQVSWVFLSSQGGRNRVGLYHGDSSGHLVIHCNMRVVQVDFSVRESRNYSFFIDDELVEIQLIQVDNHFEYNFEVNKTADTPLNRVRKVVEAKDQRQLRVFIAAFVVLLIGTTIGLSLWGKSQKHSVYEKSLSSGLSEKAMRLLSRDGRNSTAKMYLIVDEGVRKVFYSFPTTENVIISGKFGVSESGPIILPTGFPLQDKDVFSVTYLPEDPQVHRVDFDNPDNATLENYIAEAMKIELTVHPELSQGHAACFVNLFIEKYGWAKLAYFLNQTENPEIQKIYNRDAYLRLIRDPEFEKEAQSRCWKN